MGLFDKIVKNAVGNAVGGAINDALEKATGVDLNQDGVNGENADLGIPQQSTQAARQQSTPFDSGAGTKDHAFFAGLLAENFAEYQVAENAPVSQLGGDGRPYDFLLSKDGKPAAAIMLTEGNRYKNQPFIKAKASAEAAGVPFLNFFLRLPNQRDYVINRIKTAL
jgi:hypothetical protein